MDGDQSEVQAETPGTSCPSDSLKNTEVSRVPRVFYVTKTQESIIDRAVRRVTGSGATRVRHVALYLICLEFAAGLDPTRAHAPSAGGGPRKRERFRLYPDKAELVEETINDLVSAKLCQNQAEAVTLVCWTFLQDDAHGMTALDCLKESEP